VSCPQLQEEWDAKKSAKSNMEKVGLAYNINKIMKIPSVKDELTQFAKGSKKDAVMKDLDSTSKSQVVQELEREAASETEQAKKRKQLRLSQPEIRYCIYMIEKYGDEYDRMARDPKNAYQDTPAQIRRKIETFKSIPIQYNAYLRSKGLLSENGAAPMETN